MEYINQVRINLRARLCSTRTKNYPKLLFDCGFRNIPNFNRRFKENVIVRLVNYRRDSKNNNKHMNEF